MLEALRKYRMGSAVDLMLTPPSRQIAVCTYPEKLQAKGPTIGSIAIRVYGQLERRHSSRLQNAQAMLS